MNKLKKEVNKKDPFFFTSKTSFQLFAPAKLRTFFVSTQKKNNENLQNTPGGFSLSRLCGGKLHVPKNPYNLFCWEVFSILFLDGQSFLWGRINLFRVVCWTVRTSNQRRPRVQNHSATWVAICQKKIGGTSASKRGVDHETVDAVMGGKSPRVWLGYKEWIFKCSLEWCWWWTYNFTAVYVFKWCVFQLEIQFTNLKRNMIIYETSIGHLKKHFNFFF